MMVMVMMVMVTTMMSLPNDEVKLGKVETYIVNTKHVVFLTQLGTVLRLY